jgi:hypothetical protein
MLETVGKERKENRKYPEKTISRGRIAAKIQIEVLLM